MTTTKLPQVDLILRQDCLASLESRFRRDLLATLVREELASLRAFASAQHTDAQAIAAAVAERAQGLLTAQLRSVINGTGVVLNTNLGRAPISRQALSDTVSVAGGYCNLEIELDTGKRGQRSQRMEELLTLITGAEAALVVNNNAAAVVLAVNAFSRNKKVLVSRGELIEIGGSFRLPSVIEASGGILCEVGTTNRTRIGDYAQAIDSQCGLLLSCHRSNFEIRGFTESASLGDLCALSKESSLPLLVDLGSGILAELKDAGLESEPTVPQVLKEGCDLVSFSGDKLLGGPQAGFIVGKKTLVEKLRKHPLYRALRVDKIALLLIERTLIAYLSPDPQAAVPVLAMLSATPADLKLRCDKFTGTICDVTNKLTCRSLPTRSRAGGGSLPEQETDSFGIEISCPQLSANRIAQYLRRSEPPVIGIINEDRFMLDFRTIALSEEPFVRQAILTLSKQLP